MKTEPAATSASTPTDQEIDEYLEAWANLTDEQLREVGGG